MRAALLPLLTSLLFSGSYIGGKYTTLDLGPLTTTLARYAIAWLVLAVMLTHHGRSALRVDRGDRLAMLGLGLTGIIGYHYFFFSSLRYTDVANTAIINALSPVLTAVAAAALLGERLSRRAYGGIAIAFSGVLLLLARGEPRRLLDVDFNPGDLLMLLSVVSWMLYALLIKHLSARYSGYTLTFYATATGVLALVPLSLSEAPLHQLSSMSGASALSIIYMGVFASGIGYLTYNLSIAAIGPTRTSSFVYSTVPVLVAGLAFAFFAEPITLPMVISIILIVAGLRQMLRG